MKMANKTLYQDTLSYGDDMADEGLVNALHQGVRGYVGTSPSHPSSFPSPCPAPPSEPP